MKANEPAYPVSEVWKWVKGYENLYSVSNLGRVKSIGRQIHYVDGRNGEFRKGRMMKITDGRKFDGNHKEMIKLIMEIATKALEP